MSKDCTNCHVGLENNHGIPSPVSIQRTSFHSKYMDSYYTIVVSLQWGSLYWGIEIPIINIRRSGTVSTLWWGSTYWYVVSFSGLWWHYNDRNWGIGSYYIMMKQNEGQLNKGCPGKSSQNCHSYSVVTCAHFMIVSWDQVARLFLLGNACSNHYYVTARFPTIHFIHTLHK